MSAEEQKEVLKESNLKRKQTDPVKELRGVNFQANESLFASMTFYLEIYHKGENKNAIFESSIVEHGGKVSKRMGKNVTHLIWSGGKLKTLDKAIQHSIHAISPLWLKESLENLKCLPESDFRPYAYQDRIDYAQGKGIQMHSNKKRGLSEAE